MTTISRVTIQGKDKQVLNGIETELQAIPTLYLGGEVFTPVSLTDFIQNRIALANTIDTTRAAWEAALSAYDAVGKKTDLVIGDLRHTVMAAFGRQSPVLASFGFSPMHVPFMTAEQRAIAVKKAKATRKARGTMGKKQKAQIKGAVPTAPAPVAADTTPTSPVAS